MTIGTINPLGAQIVKFSLPIPHTLLPVLLLLFIGHIHVLLAAKRLLLRPISNLVFQLRAEDRLDHTALMRLNDGSIAVFALDNFGVVREL